jgi:hypothetical protein
MSRQNNDRSIGDEELNSQALLQLLAMRTILPDPRGSETHEAAKLPKQRDLRGSETHEATRPTRQRDPRGTETPKAAILGRSTESDTGKVLEARPLGNLAV